MVQVLISQHDDNLVAHVLTTQKAIPSFISKDDLVASFNVSQIFLNL